MPHVIFGGEDIAQEPEPALTATESQSHSHSHPQAHEPVASTSKLAVATSESRAKQDHSAESAPVPVSFKKKKDKKRQASISSGHAGSAVANGSQFSAPSKKVRTFYDNNDEDEDDEDDDASIRGWARQEGGVHMGGQVLSKKEARKQLQKERKERAELLLASRMKLPVWYARDKILEEIDKLDTIVVLGETGSGKTTQIPQFLLHSKVCRPEPRICVTQPRRVAATSLARRVAEEVGCPLGNLVGYTVRFDDVSSPKTRLKYLTDGTLLQEILGDRLLECYDVVVIDEAHERTLRTDMILGFLKDIQKKRKEMARAGEKGPKTGQQVGPLKIVVMSATLDAERFSNFYDKAKVLYVKGREYKVTVKYLDRSVQDYLEAALKVIFQLHCDSPPGDVLVFLSGQEEIESLRAQLDTYLPTLDPRKMKMLICPLYARLTPAEQNKAFNLAPPNTRKIILATNIAETSITISGIKYVIDTGLSKEKVYHPTSGMDSLLLSPISKSSATQRAGRAGRESNGICFRLYPESVYRGFRHAVPPEIQRCSLSFALLHLKASGQDDVFKFEYMDRPEDSAIAAALLELVGLDALDTKGRITETGRQMASLPLEPRQAKTLLASFEHECTSEIVDLLALLGSADQLLSVPFQHREAAAEARSKFVHRTGDHMMLLNILKAFEEVCDSLHTPKERKAWCNDHFLSLKTLNQVLDSRKQIRERVERMGKSWRSSAKDNDDLILTCLLQGHFANTAMRMPDNTYRRATGAMKIKIHPSSILQGKRVDAVVFSELIFTKDVYARIASSIPLMWLRTKVKPFFAHQSAVTDGEQAGTVLR